MQSAALLDEQETGERDNRTLGAVVTGNAPVTLADIYNPEVNLAIWQLQLPSELQRNLTEELGSASTSSPKLNITKIVTPESVSQDLKFSLEAFDFAEPLLWHITNLVDMFACLFELKRVGLRLAVLEHAMCPRFHVDKIPCRLVTTLFGDGTQWLDNDVVDRSKLATGEDERSGLFGQQSQVQSLSTGDVALLKGEAWQGNEGRGLIHRSPKASAIKRRLVLTLDFVD